MRNFIVAINNIGLISFLQPYFDYSNRLAHLDLKLVFEVIIA